MLLAIHNNVYCMTLCKDKNEENIHPKLAVLLERVLPDCLLAIYHWILHQLHAALNACKDDIILVVLVKRRLELPHRNMHQMHHRGD